jgi:DNA-binding transcriptional MerR regulator
LITPEYNPENRYRIFSDQDLKRLAIIALLRQLHMPVEKIRIVLDGKISMSDLLRQRLRTIDTAIESMKGVVLLQVVSLRRIWRE